MFLKLINSIKKQLYVKNNLSFYLDKFFEKNEFKKWKKIVNLYQK